MFYSKSVNTRPTARPTVQSVLDQNNGVAPGFHFVRYALALTIFAFHSYYVVRGQIGAVGYNDLLGQTAAASTALQGRSGIVEALRPFLFALVGGFFALSGFLVTGSAERQRSVKTFLGFRGLRIFPALAVETLLSAFLLGPIASDLSLKAYFQAPEFFRYFGNILGFVSFELPGVFMTNPVPAIVNVNLWTLPGEFYCYLVLAVAIVTGAIYNRRFLASAVGLATIAFFAAIWLLDIKTRSNTTHFSTVMIVYYFFIGCLVFAYRKAIPIRLGLFVASVVAYWSLTYFAISDILAAPCLTYAIVFVGCQKFRLFDRVMTGDYSYGIYLYGFPIQQLFVWAFPDVNSPLLVFVAAGSVTLAFAVSSWFLIEKPALRLKRFLKPASAAGKTAPATLAQHQPAIDGQRLPGDVTGGR